MHGTPSCVASACQIACANGFGDCDGNAGTGCETDLTTINDCGSCGTQCAAANGTSACVSGACAVAACNNGFGDCDSDPANGCEVSLGNTPAHCGACGNVCNLAHATSGCASGACTIAACSAGYADCDGNAANGCEVDVTADAGNCGGCGTVCSSVHGTPSCVASACQIACANGFGNCDGNAGNGCEVNLANTVSSCGACGNACAAPNGTPTCANGACGVAACNVGYDDCDGNPANGCEVHLVSDANNCAGCGNECNLAHATAACNVGLCAIASCDAGYDDCDGNPANGCEVDLASDAANCGGCAAACSSNHGTPACVNGACQIACANGYADCDGNPANGCEQDLGGDVNHCGACGNVCNLPFATPACNVGACVIAQCAAIHADCDGVAGNGCEVNLATNNNHCGVCGNACNLANAVSNCVSGDCAVGSCSAGYANCDNQPANGCEVNLDSDDNNCGACGTVCVGGQTCQSGACQ